MTDRLPILTLLGKFIYKVCAEFEYDALLLGIRGELRPNANEDVEKLIEDMLALTITLPVERLTVIPSPAVLLIESTPELAFPEKSWLKFCCTLSNAVRIASADGSSGKDPKSIFCCALFKSPYLVFIVFS